MSANDPAQPSAPQASRSASVPQGEKRRPGRPRKDERDDTPADRRKVQLRLAQRKSRSKKESHLVSKNNQIEHLHGTINAMNTSFLQLNRSVLDSGILQARPDLLAKFQETARSFVQLIHAIDRWDRSDPPAAQSALDTPSGFSSISEGEPYSAPPSLRSSYFAFSPAAPSDSPAGPQPLLSYITEPAPSSGINQAQWSFAGNGVESFGRRLHYNTSYFAHWSLVGSDDLSRHIASIFFRLSSSGRKREDIAATLSRTLASIARVSDRIDLHAYQETAREVLKKRSSRQTPSPAGIIGTMASDQELLSPYDTEIYLNDRGVRFFENATLAILTTMPPAYVPPSQRRRARPSSVRPEPSEVFGSSPIFASSSLQRVSATGGYSSDEEDEPSQSYIVQRVSSAPESSNTRSKSSLQGQSLSITASPERELDYFQFQKDPTGTSQQYGSRTLEGSSGSDADADVTSPLEEDEIRASVDPQPRLSSMWKTSGDETVEESKRLATTVATDVREENVDVECLLRNIAVRGICNGYSIAFPKRAVDEALAQCIESV